MPLVSAIITTHNRLELLPRAIDSVLKQDYDNIQLIVVDDASSDGTQDYLIEQQQKGYLIYCRIDESKGANNARNEGIKLSSGEYLAFLDDDDYWSPQKIGFQIEILQQNLDVALVGGWYGVGEDLIKPPAEISLRVMLSENGLGGFSIGMFRKKDLISVGGLSLDLMNSQEWDLWIRLAQLGKVSVAQECLMYYDAVREDRISVRKNVQQYYDNYYKVVKRYWHLMGFWTRRRHYFIVAYQTTDRGKYLVRLVFGGGLFVSRGIDRWQVKRETMRQSS